MAKDRRKLLHIHSSVVDKQPTAASLEVGEIAVNNAKDQEFLSIKNTDNKVVRFSSDEKVVTIMEKKEVIPYSGVVDNVHLDTNRSNIEIKLNQVVAGNTVKHDVVNGAKDIDNELVNPTSDSGLTNGAGFAIDMSRYAMIGANPSFSSITSDNKATIEGELVITGTGLSTKLSWVYDNVCTESSGETNFRDNKTFKIPSSVSHLKRETLSWTYGDARAATASTYDPGQNSSSNCTESTGFVIPQSIDDLTNWNNTCISLPHDVCVSGKVTASDGFFQSSDRNLKENVRRPSFDKAISANATPIVAFNYISDQSKRDTYGVIAQEVEANGLGELIHTDENGYKAVDYTSLMILKIAYLENEIKLLRDRLDAIGNNIE